MVTQHERGRGPVSIFVARSDVPNNYCTRLEPLCVRAGLARGVSAAISPVNGERPGAWSERYSTAIDPCRIWSNATKGERRSPSVIHVSGAPASDNEYRVQQKVTTGITNVPSIIDPGHYRVADAIYGGGTTANMWWASQYNANTRHTVIDNDGIVYTAYIRMNEDTLRDEGVVAKIDKTNDVDKWGVYVVPTINQNAHVVYIALTVNQRGDVIVTWTEVQPVRTEEDLPYTEAIGSSLESGEDKLYCGILNKETMCLENVFEIQSTNSVVMEKLGNQLVWVVGPVLNTGRYWGGGDGNATSAITCGGVEPIQDTILQSAEVLNTNVWNVISSMPEARAMHGCSGSPSSAVTTCGVDSKYYIINTCRRYNGTSWASITNAPATIYLHRQRGESTNVLVTGGANTSNDTIKTCYKWNGSAWSTLSNMLEERESHYAAGNASNALVGGGNRWASGTFFGEKNTSERFNGSAWVSIANITRNMADGMCGGTTTDAVAMGGTTGMGYYTVNDGMRYNGTVWTGHGRLYGFYVTRNSGGYGGSSNGISIGGYGVVVNIAAYTWRTKQGWGTFDVSTCEYGDNICVVFNVVGDRIVCVEVDPYEMSVVNATGTQPTTDTRITYRMQSIDYDSTRTLHMVANKLIEYWDEGTFIDQIAVGVLIDTRTLEEEDIINTFQVLYPACVIIDDDDVIHTMFLEKRSDGTIPARFVYAKKENGTWENEFINEVDEFITLMPMELYMQANTGRRFAGQLQVCYRNLNEFENEKFVEAVYTQCLGRYDEEAEEFVLTPCVVRQTRTSEGWSEPEIYYRDERMWPGMVQIGYTLKPFSGKKSVMSGQEGVISTITAEYIPSRDKFAEEGRSSNYGELIFKPGGNAVPGVVISKGEEMINIEEYTKKYRGYISKSKMNSYITTKLS